MKYDKFWHQKKVLITGHTGFKGSWMSMMLTLRGAKVFGYSLKPPTDPSLFEICRIDRTINSTIGDVRDFNNLLKTIKKIEPELIIHMAAQPIVADSYKMPRETYEVNVMGTVNLLECVRLAGGVRSFVNITTDKCYEDTGKKAGYREDDRLGGYDPYANSKACSEMVTMSYRRSFFNPSRYNKHQTSIASARAGNIIGGGDFANNRLVPDFIRSVLQKKSMILRNPLSIRPWQHVFDAISGYLTLAKKLHENGKAYSRAWNFGPDAGNSKTAEWIVKELCEKWGMGCSYLIKKTERFHETEILKLDATAARKQLGWRPKYGIERSLEEIIQWLRAYQGKRDMFEYCMRKLEEFERERS